MVDYIYDGLGNLLTVPMLDGTVYVFASGGLLSRVEEDDGQHITRIIRDEDGMITKLISPSQEELLVEMDENGNTTAYTYDAGGNLLTETAPDGGVTNTEYDRLGRIIAVTIYTYGKQIGLKANNR